MPDRDFILECFVALDLETTGFDFKNDEIIEVGAVKVESGEIVDTFEQYVFTDKPIPYRVKTITGITEGDLGGSKPSAEVLGELAEFIGTLPIIAHNAQFDVGFASAKGYEPKGAVYDTLAISRIVLPRSVDHRLGTLLLGFGIESEVSHRAGADALGLARLFLALCEEMKRIDPRTLRRINSILSTTAWEGKEIFLAAERLALKSALTAPGSSYSPQFVGARKNTFGEGSVRSVKEKVPLDTHVVEGFFSADGLLARSLGGFEKRPEQSSMAKACARAFNEDGFLVVEAGTGTGKSLAYLLPAALWSIQNGERVIVSTNTKNLQDQLFFKDIPSLSRSSGKLFKASLLKGRGNYVCRTKLESLIADPGAGLAPAERIGILPLVVWIEDTETGEISECTGFRQRDFPGIHSAVCCEWNYCLGKKCSFRDACFLNRIRDAASRSHIVVVNHALLLSDLVAKSRALGDYSRLILDEAHNLEDAATEHMGRKASSARVVGMLDSISPEKGYGGGLLGRIERWLKGEKKALSKSIEGLRRLVSETRIVAEELFGEIYRVMRTQAEYGKRRYSEQDDRIKAVVPDGIELVKRLKQLRDGLSGLRAWIGAQGEGKEGYAEINESITAREVDLIETAADIEFLIKADDPGHCYWTETRSRNDLVRCELKSAPIDVGRDLGGTLYEKLASAIFTSASITVASSFDFFMERTGVARFGEERLTTLLLGSPFDYEGQTLALLARFLPSPQSAGFADASARLLEKVILGTRRGTLVLVTSYAMLNDLSSRLVPKLEENGITVLVQGESGSRTRILEEFKADRTSVVLGTDSFWEGVDVPGDPLETVVIGKLPFPVPNEPIIEARTEALEERSLDAFSSYMLPRAVIKFRQGFGRLIRTRTDLGVVIIMDPRTGSASYGDVFISSLPAQVTICSTEQELLRNVEQFWRLNNGEKDKGACENEV
jgi:ATP-dependent DNA helicase DinG